MKTVMIDMDDVILKNNLEKYIQEFMGRKVEFDKECKKYRDEVLEGVEEEFKGVYANKNLYENVSLFEGCYNVIKKLNSVYDVYICTDFVFNKETFNTKKVLMDKYDYLRKNLDFISPNKFIFGKCKNFMYFDYKIDDRINNLDNSGCKLLFTTGQNKNISDNELNEKKIIRVNNWSDIEKILLGSEASAR